MPFLSKIFGKKKTNTLELDGLGEFSYFNDGTDEYWSIEQPVGMLPSMFNFGAISGNQEGPDSEALETFRFYAASPDDLYPLLNELFFDKLRDKFGHLTLRNIQTDFHLKTLTCTSNEEFEFGFQSNKDDLFVELFFRGDSVTEVHIDEN